MTLLSNFTRKANYHLNNIFEIIEAHPSLVFTEDIASFLYENAKSLAKEALQEYKLCYNSEANEIGYDTEELFSKEEVKNRGKFITYSIVESELIKTYKEMVLDKIKILQTNLEKKKTVKEKPPIKIKGMSLFLYFTITYAIAILIGMGLARLL